MSNKKSKKKWVVAATSLAVVAALAATFAWFQSEDSAKNHFEGDLAGNDVEVIETFTPPVDWKPGDKVNKDVAVMNTGDYDSLIRVSFEEILTKLKNPNSELRDYDDTSFLEKATKDTMYLYPLDTTRLTTGEFSTAKDSVITPTQEMKITEGDYKGTWTLKAKEVEVSTSAGTTHKYLSYWENGQDKLYAKVSQYVRDDENKISPQNKPQFKFMDLTTNKPVTIDWTAPVYTPEIKPDDNGNATIFTAVDENITLQFVNLVSNDVAKTDKGLGKWTYNAKDGYFYYIGVVSSQGQTAQLLDSVILSSNAGNEYSKVQFDLIVNAKAIQANKEAVNSTSWLNNTNADINSALSGLSF